MIISLKEDFDRELGTSLPMISRAGKSTIPQHLCFNNAPGNKKEFNFTKKDEAQNDDFSLLLGDKQKTDLKTEMQKIAEAERRKSQGQKRNMAGHSQGGPVRTTGGFFIPFDQKKKRDDHSSKIKSSSFAATSRDAWATSHASKTNPPEVGKYKPKFSQVEHAGLETVIRKPKVNIGKERIEQRDLQHSLCFSNQNKFLKMLCHSKNPGKRKHVPDGQEEDHESADGAGGNTQNPFNAGALNLNLPGDNNPGDLRTGTPGQNDSTRRMTHNGSGIISPRA